MRCWKIVTIAGSIGKIAVVNSRLHDTFVSSNNRLLHCLSFLDRFRLGTLNMVDRKVGGCNLKKISKDYFDQKKNKLFLSLNPRASLM